MAARATACHAPETPFPQGPDADLMTGSRLALEAATGDGLATVERLLARNDLPAADVRDGPARFFLGVVDGERVGAGGLETPGAAGLLRSVVVAAPYRGRGYGHALCDRLEARARQTGVEDLYLLTTTAAPFFADRGFARVDRDGVPAPVRATSEFADLCPDTAVAMRKRLS